jgi:hypothetical protein
MSGLLLSLVEQHDHWRRAANDQRNHPQARTNHWRQRSHPFQEQEEKGHQAE